MSREETSTTWVIKDTTKILTSHYSQPQVNQLHKFETERDLRTNYEKKWRLIVSWFRKQWDSRKILVFFSAQVTSVLKGQNDLLIKNL